FEVDDVNLVTVTEDVRGHLGVPVTGLVTKVDTGFQHFAHEGHNVLRGLVLALGLYRIMADMIWHPGWLNARFSDGQHGHRNGLALNPAGRSPWRDIRNGEQTQTTVAAKDLQCHDILGPAAGDIRTDGSGALLCTQAPPAPCHPHSV